MRKIVIAVGGLLVLGMLAWVAYYYGRPYWEPSLPFQTIARSSVGSYGLPLYPFYPNGLTPGLLIIAKGEDLDTLTPNAFAGNPELAARVRQSDFSRSFAVLALRGQANPSHNIEIRRITRQGDRVTVWTSFIRPPEGSPELQVISYPFHLVGVSKQGAWGSHIRFALMDGYESVAEATHYIPA